jgi:hypothetical protein
VSTSLNSGGTDDPGISLHSQLLGALPLIVLTGFLFVATYLTYHAYPKVGPYNFPLWGLLMTLGFVAAIGAVVSGFFATDGPVPPRAPRGRGSGARPPDGSDSRADFGRPVPLAPTTGKSAGTAGGPARPAAIAQPQAKPWDEDVLPPVPPRGPRPVLTTLDDPGEIGRALQEIADIQRELAARQSPVRTSTETPTRA